MSIDSGLDKSAPACNEPFPSKDPDESRRENWRVHHRFVCAGHTGFLVRGAQPRFEDSNGQPFQETIPRDRERPFDSKSWLDAATPRRSKTQLANCRDNVPLNVAAEAVSSTIQLPLQTGASRSMRERRQEMTDRSPAQTEKRLLHQHTAEAQTARVPCPRACVVMREISASRAEMFQPRHRMSGEEDTPHRGRNNIVLWWDPIPPPAGNDGRPARKGLHLLPAMPADHTARHSAVQPRARAAQSRRSRSLRPYRPKPDCRWLIDLSAPTATLPENARLPSGRRRQTQISIRE